MAGETRSFTPIYRDIMEEPEVWDDDVVCLAFFRLRLTADRAYPEAADIPRRVSDEAVAKLAALGKIQLVGRDQYRCRGVDMDRTRKSDHGRAAANARWGPHAPALPVHPPSNPPAKHPQSASNARPMPTDKDTDKETLTNVPSESPNAREPRRSRTPVRGFTGPLER